MNCPTCEESSKLEKTQELKDGLRRRWKCKGCSTKFITKFSAIDGKVAEVFDRFVGELRFANTEEKKFRRTLDYAAAWSEIREAAIGTMYLPWRQI